MAVAPAVLGASQLVSGIAGASSARRQATANNKAQQASLESQAKQLAAQEQATLEQSVLSQMEVQQNRAFSQYQTQLGQLERQTAYQQQTATLSAQGQMENMQAAQAGFSNEADRLTMQMQAQQAQLQSGTELANQQIAGQQQRGQVEGQRFQSLLGAGNDQRANEMQRYNTMLEAGQAGNQNEMARYQALIGSANATNSAEMQRGNAQIGNAQQQEQIAAQARQVYDQLESAAAQQGKKLTTGEKRRASMQAMFAAAGMVTGQTDLALLANDLNDDTAEYIDTQMKVNNISDETAMMMVSQGRISELAMQLGVQDADRQARQAGESATMANIQADNTNETLGQQVGQANRMADANNSSIDFQRLMANMSAEQQQQLINGQMTYAQAVAQFSNNQTNNAVNNANRELDNSNTNIAQQQNLNNQGRDAAQTQFQGAMNRDAHTDYINSLMSDTGFRIQSGAAASQAQNQLASLNAQRQALVYTPQRAPSLLGSIVSSGINAGAGYYGATQGQAQTSRAQQLSLGNTQYGTSYGNMPSYNSNVTNGSAFTGALNYSLLGGS